MNKLLFLLSITMLSIAFIGCDGSDNDPNTQENSGNENSVGMQHTLIITVTAPEGFLGDFYIYDTHHITTTSNGYLQPSDNLDEPKCTNTNTCTIEQEWYSKNAALVSQELPNNQHGYNNTFIYFDESSGSNVFVPLYISGVFEQTGPTHHNAEWNENQWGANVHGYYVDTNDQDYYERKLLTHIEYFQFDNGPFNTQWYEDTHEDWRVCLSLRHEFPNAFSHAQHINVVLGDTFSGTRDTDTYTIEGTISEDRQVLEYREIGPGFDYLGRLEFQHD